MGKQRSGRKLQQQRKQVLPPWSSGRKLFHRNVWGEWSGCCGHRGGAGQVRAYFLRSLSHLSRSLLFILFPSFPLSLFPFFPLSFSLSLPFSIDVSPLTQTSTPFPFSFSSHLSLIQSCDSGRQPVNGLVSSRKTKRAGVGRRRGGRKRERPIE